MVTKGSGDKPLENIIIMENKKPKMYDPEEFEIIRQIYFPKKSESTNDQENYERQDIRKRNLNNNSR